MRRREFLSAAASAAGIFLPGLARAQSKPCPPGLISSGPNDWVTTECAGDNSGSAPAWFTSITDGTWGTVASGGTISSVYPSPIPQSNLGGESPYSICDAWTGGSVDQTRKEYMLCANGGHADYAGNEAYAISLQDASPAWRRLSDPTPNSYLTNITGGAATYPDGRPRAMHSCFQCFGDGRVWFPLANSVSSAGGGTPNSVVSYDRDSLGAASSPLAHTVSNLGPWALHGAIPGAGDLSSYIFGTAVFDPIGHYAYGLAGNSANSTIWWRIKTQGSNIGVVETRFQAGQSFGHWGTWSICAPDLRLIVAGDHLRNVVTVLNLNTNTWSQVSNITGSGYYAQGAGGAYVASNNSIAVGNPISTGKTIYRLTIPTSGGSYNPSGQWVWSTINPNGANPNSFSRPGSNNAAYSKWNIVENMGNGQSAIVFVPSVTGPVFVYKVPMAGL